MQPEPRSDLSFSTQEVLSCVPGLTMEVLKQWLNREVVELEDRSPVGRGKRRAYSAWDVFQIAAIHELARQGLFVSKARIVWQVVQGRLIALQHGLAPAGEVQSAFFCLHPDTGDLVARVFDEHDPQGDGMSRDDAPDVAVLFRVDRFIKRVFDRMEAVKAGKEAHPGPAPADSSQHSNPAGLTAEEAAELEAIAATASRDPAAYARYRELFDKQEAARLARINNEGRN